MRRIETSGYNNRALYYGVGLLSLLGLSVIVRRILSSRNFRYRFPVWHRRSGRVFLVFGGIVGITAR